VVLKLWQVSDAFDATAFFEGLKSTDYDWDDLKRLLRPNDRTEPETIIKGIEFHFKALRDLSDLEREVVADAGKGARNGPLAERLRVEIRERFALG
jgi:hypothetical protein